MIYVVFPDGEMSFDTLRYESAWYSLLGQTTAFTNHWIGRVEQACQQIPPTQQMQQQQQALTDERNRAYDALLQQLDYRQAEQTAQQARRRTDRDWFREWFGRPGDEPEWP